MSDVRTDMADYTLGTATAVDLVANERRRQVTEEGWTAEHDAKHYGNEIAFAAAIYALPAERRERIMGLWPWDESDFKPGGHTTEGRIRDLTKAGALILAEMDRLLAAWHANP